MGLIGYLLVPQLVEPSSEHTLSLTLVGDRPRNLQFQLGPSFRPAPCLQARTDSGRAFPHSTHSPVPCLAPGLNNLWIDAGAVISEAQTHARRFVRDLDFNVFRGRVAHRVDKRLVSDPECFVSYERVEVTPLSFYDNAELDAVTDCELLDGSRECIR